MGQGYGYGGEGDWKVSAMTHMMKKMAEGLGGGTAFMEDYTYDLAPGNELSLGAHMLEVCPSLAADTPPFTWIRWASETANRPRAWCSRASPAPPSWRRWWTWAGACA